jgi:predicted nucleic acid-binding protein
MAESVYLETTFVSYLTSRPSRDFILRADQEITRQWWTTRRLLFDLYISESVVNEAKGGDTERAEARLKILRELPLLRISDESISLAKDLIQEAALPTKAAEDALHIAIATTNGMNYLMTWNCKHIANARLLDKIKMICSKAGLQCPVICTPRELLED